MKDKFSSLLAGAFAAAMGISAGALAQGVQTDAYLVDSRGQVVKNAFGLCWRTSQWTPGKAIGECDPDLVQKAAAPTPRALDSDGDGVPDDRDRCPATPAGVKVDAQGCELDSDGDGVVDRLDRCLGTPRGAKVNAQGCELDSDGDGVVDRLDKCPGSRPGAKVDANGCEVLAAISLKGVNFATRSATLTRDSSAILDEAAAVLLKRGDFKAEVAGHTDNRGSPAHNKTLSQRRAETVMRYLVSKGVSAGNLSASGYGQERPIADNATAQGRAANRRVEFVFK